MSQLLQNSLDSQYSNHLRPRKRKKKYTVESPIFLKVILTNYKYALSKAGFFHFTYSSIVTLNISKLFMNCKQILKEMKMDIY
jgi:hypothetical protein